jgi:GNAT superfamily N-acetyltransferase
VSANRLAALRHTPPLLLVQKILRRVPFKLVDVGKLCFLRLDRIPRVPAGLLRGPGIVRRATIDDLDALVVFRNQRVVFLDRFAEGDDCFVAEVDHRIVGYEWFCERDVHEETAWGYRIVVPPGFVYAYDAFIDPQFRNSGIWLRFKAYLGERMIEAGNIGVLTFIDYGNWPSLRTHLRFGFKPDLEVFVLKIMGKLLSRTSTPSRHAASQLAGVPVP